MESQPEHREVTLWLMVSVILIPPIFAWFTLRRGYSTIVRVLAFTWLVLYIIGYSITPEREPSNRIANIKSSDSRQSDKITIQKFNSLYMGMSYSQAASTLGKDGTLSSENKFGDYETELYHWSCGFMCGIDLYFSNGKLSQKNQIGLSK